MTNMFLIDINSVTLADPLWPLFLLTQSLFFFHVIFQLPF